MNTIFVTQRTNYIPEINESRDCLDVKLNEFIISCSFLPINIPNSLSVIDDLEEWFEKFSPVGIVFSGGENIGVNKIRDQLEKKLISFAVYKKIPIFGICRGLQVLGLNSGVVKLKPVNQHVKVNHMVKGHINRVVNSYHNYALEACPNGYKVLARTADDNIEAIFNKEFQFLGIMWHPEREKMFQARRQEIDETVNETRGIILAAGRGSRMKTHTDDKPKCLIEFLGIHLSNGN